jgi:outer membrane lipoprotein carrier protein
MSSDGGGGVGRKCRLAAGLLVAAGLVFGAPARATPTDQLHAFLSQTTSARGDFTQQSPGPRSQTASGASTTGKPVISRGSFEFLRPGKFRWTYRTPYEQLIVSDGQHLFLFDKDLNQVTRKKLAGALPASPASILFGSNDFERDFTVADDGTQDGIDWIRATPNSKDSLFERIRIGFQSGMPVAMQLRDSFGQSTELAFDHVQRNPALSADRFVYTPPPGVDVLEEQ